MLNVQSKLLWKQFAANNNIPQFVYTLSLCELIPIEAQLIKNINYNDDCNEEAGNGFFFFFINLINVGKRKREREYNT